MKRSSIVRFMQANGVISGGREHARWLELPTGKWFPRRLLEHQEQRRDPRRCPAASQDGQGR